MRSRSAGAPVSEDDAVVRRAMAAADPEEVKRAGNDQYRKGCFEEALRLYDRALALCPDNAACRANRAAALIGLRRLGEAVKDCEEALRIDPSYGRARQRLTSLHIRFFVPPFSFLRAATVSFAARTLIYSDDHVKFIIGSFVLTGSLAGLTEALHSCKLFI